MLPVIASTLLQVRARRQVNTIKRYSNLETSWVSGEDFKSTFDTGGARTCVNVSVTRLPKFRQRLSAFH